MVGIRPDSATAPSEQHLDGQQRVSYDGVSACLDGDLHRGRSSVLRYWVRDCHADRIQVGFQFWRCCSRRRSRFARHICIGRFAVRCKQRIRGPTTVTQCQNHAAHAVKEREIRVT